MKTTTEKSNKDDMFYWYKIQPTIL